jgi:hypothetical protein
VQWDRMWTAVAAFVDLRQDTRLIPVQQFRDLYDPPGHQVSAYGGRVSGL